MYFCGHLLMMGLIEQNRGVIYRDLGQIRYKDAWDLQTRFHKEIVDRKLKNRSQEIPELIHHYLLFCEHNPVFTLGKSGSMNHLLIDESELEQENFEFFKINRGGDITYHGPGQITGYPIFDLDHFFTDVHRYVRSLEECVIRTIAEYGIIGDRIENYTGVWIKAEDENHCNRKICAVGVHLSRWVTMHGFALNVSTDLKHFDRIIPCGIDDKNMEVTSIENEIGELIPMDEVKFMLKNKFKEIFEFEFITK